MYLGIPQPRCIVIAQVNVTLACKTLCLCEQEGAFDKAILTVAEWENQQCAQHSDQKGVAQLGSTALRYHAVVRLDAGFAPRNVESPGLLDREGFRHAAATVMHVQQHQEST